MKKEKAYSNIKSYALKHRSGSSNTHVGYKCLEIAQNPYGVLAHLIQQIQHNIEGLFLWESVMNYKLVWDESIQYNHQYRIDDLYQNIFQKWV